MRLEFEILINIVVSWGGWLWRVVNLIQYSESFLFYCLYLSLLPFFPHSLYFIWYVNNCWETLWILMVTSEELVVGWPTDRSLWACNRQSPIIKKSKEALMLKIIKAKTLPNHFITFMNMEHISFVLCFSVKLFYVAKSSFPASLLSSVTPRMVERKLSVYNTQLWVWHTYSEADKWNSVLCWCLTHPSITYE